MARVSNSASEGAQEQVRDGAWIDFSGIENPFGTPESFSHALAEAVEAGMLSDRPDKTSRALRSALSRTLGLDETSFLIGTTPSNMIGAVAQAFEPCAVGVAIPCPAEYVVTLSNTGHRIERIFSPASFLVPNAELLAEQGVRIEAAVLANPSFPTSRLLSQPVLISYLETCDWVVVDERSVELTLGAASVAPLVETYKNLVVVQSFTEQYALPGAHVSYCIAHPETIAEIGRFYDDTSITMLPDVFAAPSLLEHPKLEGVRGFLYSEIPWMQCMLSLIPGIDIFPAEANYVMCSYSNDGSIASDVADVEQLAARLEKRGFSIRELAGTPGLGSKDFFSVAVRTRQENEQLIAAIRSILEGAV